MQFCFATNNTHKLEEVQAMLPPGIELLTLQQVGCTTDPPEDELTLEANSHSKAGYVYTHHNVPCFADDSGLEVAALNGEPGVYSARYAGMQRDNAANMALLLHNLQDVPADEREARFRTVLTLVLPDGAVHQFEGAVYGRIIEQPRGTNGFGYDPVFVPEGETRTFAEMSAQEKNAMSHRRKAVEQLVAFLNKLSE